MRLPEVIPNQTNADKYLQRLKDLDSASTGVRADQELAAYRAYQNGLPVETIAHWTGTNETSVLAMIEELANEDPDDWSDGPDWDCNGCYFA